MVIINSLMQGKDKPLKEQHYLRSPSSQDISATALHPSGKFYAAGGLSNNLGKKELAAIEIWDLVNKKQYSTIQDFHIEGIQYLEFNETGNRLLTLGLDPSKVDFRKKKIDSKSGD